MRGVVVARNYKGRKIQIMSYGTPEKKYWYRIDNGALTGHGGATKAKALAEAKHVINMSIMHRKHAKKMRKMM